MTRRATEPTTPLGKALRALRNDSGLTGKEAAAAADISQSMLSRYEIGEQVPTPHTIRSLCRVYRAPADERRQLLALAAATTEGSVDAAAVRKRGGWQMQERVSRAEQAAATITTWCPSWVDGLTQTADYARALFGEDYLDPGDVDRAVAARVERQEVLRQSGRRFRIAHTEGALMWCMGSPAVMVDQLDRLIELSHLPDVSLGVVPFGTAATVPPMHQFTIFDKSSVHFGTGHRTEFVADHRHVSRYLDYWTEFEPLIRWGDEAREVFARVRAWYAAR